jgi:hypothetical protein
MLDQIWTPGVYSENVLEEKISKQFLGQPRRASVHGRVDGPNGP